MKKNVIFGLIIMLVFGLMVMGCPTEEKEEEAPIDPSGGQVVAEQYRGTYKKGDYTFSLTATTFGNQNVSYRVWTVGSELWNYDIVAGVRKWGTFDSPVTKLTISGVHETYDGEWTKQQ